MWPEICQSEKCRGRWVALDNVRYDPSTSHPIEGDVVDVDDDLGELCARMRAADRSSCAILHCDEEVHAAPALRRPASSRSRAATH